MAPLGPPKLGETLPNPLQPRTQRARLLGNLQPTPLTNYSASGSRTTRPPAASTRIISRVGSAPVSSTIKLNRPFAQGISSRDPGVNIAFSTPANRRRAARTCPSVPTPVTESHAPAHRSIGRSASGSMIRILSRESMNQLHSSGASISQLWTTGQPAADTAVVSAFGAYS